MTVILLILIMTLPGEEPRTLRSPMADLPSCMEAARDYIQRASKAGKETGGVFTAACSIKIEKAEAS